MDAALSVKAAGSPPLQIVWAAAIVPPVTAPTVISYSYSYSYRYYVFIPIPISVTKVLYYLPLLLLLALLI